jgi:hypothetical protein
MSVRCRSLFATDIDRFVVMRQHYWASSDVLTVCLTRFACLSRTFCLPSECANDHHKDPFNIASLSSAHCRVLLSSSHSHYLPATRIYDMTPFHQPCYPSPSSHPYPAHLRPRIPSTTYLMRSLQHHRIILSRPRSLCPPRLALPHLRSQKQIIHHFARYLPLL